MLKVTPMKAVSCEQRLINLDSTVMEFETSAPDSESTLHGSNGVITVYEEGETVDSKI